LVNGVKKGLLHATALIVLSFTAYAVNKQTR
jgi:hypothetical protein